MRPIYDRAGDAVGWVSGDAVYDGHGELAAWLCGRAVFAAGGWVGEFDGEFFRDRLGCIVAFAGGAHGGVVRPVPLRFPPPDPPITTPMPKPRLAGRPQRPPGWAHPLLCWSLLHWPQYLEGCEARWPWDVPDRGAPAGGTRAEEPTDDSHCTTRSGRRPG